FNPTCTFSHSIPHLSRTKNLRVHTTTRLLNPMIRMSIQLKYALFGLSEQSHKPFPTKSHLHYPPMHPPNKWLIYIIIPNHNTRIYMNPTTSMTTCHNMIYLNPSRNQPGSI
uniref:Uncharacterized protein n=1 Tax=Oryctolagus cuniculus TaxID=9986 RepID=A0A5F9CKD1_RABIT